MAAASAHRDRLGLELTAASGEAARACDDALWEYVSFGRDPGGKLKAALALDAQMPMALLLQGYFFHLMGLPALAAKARTVFDSVSKTKNLNARERAHLSALGAWCDGELERVCEILDAILAEHPRDILALKVSNYLYFYTGKAAAVRDGPARALARWGEGAPGYAHVLALHAFGLEESGDYAAAERAGRRAPEQNPKDPRAVHAVAHVLEMQDRAAEGVAWIESLTPHWDAVNFFRFHLWWHLALLHWGTGSPDKALDLYDARIWADGSNENLSLCNDISMLARLEIAGVPVGRRWDDVAKVVRENSGGSVLAFVDAHYALALGEMPALHAGGLTGRIHADFGRALCEAMVAWRAGDHTRAADLLAPLRTQLVRVGGSHAQRDLFVLILIDAALRSGKKSLAQSVASERSRLRPGNALPARLTAVKE
jgi:tetratricopeptide (TPR) repeat protein